MAGNRLPRLHIKRRGWRPESGQSIDYTKFEVRPIPSKKIVELSIEASTTPAGKRSRTLYHHVEMSLDECTALIDRLLSACVVAAK